MYFFPDTAARCIVLLLVLLFAGSLQAQELNGEVITISENMLTVLKFKSEIKACQFGTRKGYSFQTRDNDNSVVIKSTEDNPQNTNLVITEGERTHNFIVQYQKNVDINKVKLYYDYSNLKELKKYVEKQNSSIQQPVIALNNEKRVAVTPAPEPETKQESQAQVESNKEKKAREKKEAQAKKEKEKAEQERLQREVEEQERLALEARQKAEREKAKREEERLTKEAAELQRKQEEEKRNLEAALKKQGEKEAKEKALVEAMVREQERKAQEDAKRQAEKEKRDLELAALREKQKQKDLEEKQKAELKRQEQELAAKELAAKKQREKEEAAAALAEKKRLEQARAEQLRIEKERQAEEQRLLAEKKKKEKEEADRLLALERQRLKEAELARKAEAEAKAREQRQIDSVRKRYSHAGLFNAYPGIALQDPPFGQKLGPDYFLQAETAANKAYAEILMNAKVGALTIEAEPQDDIRMTLQSIGFSGVNAFYLIRIENSGSSDFLTGLTTVAWYKYRDSSGAYLLPTYLGSKSIARDSLYRNAVKEYAFPVIPPGQSALFVVSTRAVNTTDQGQFAIQIQDRQKKKNYAIYFNGKVYNEEMNRGSSFR